VLDGALLLETKVIPKGKPLPRRLGHVDASTTSRLPAHAGSRTRRAVYNRPFLRCLHGCGLCLWRLGTLAAAQQVFERILSLNPNDDQGVRFCRENVGHGRSRETCGRARMRRAPSGAER